MYSIRKSRIKRIALKYKLGLIALLLFFALICLPWLACGLFIIIGLFVLMQKLIIKKIPLINYLAALIIIFSIAIIVRLFLFEIYRIPSESMENTLFKGDIIFLSKLNYGPKMPASEFDIPWVNSLFKFDKKKAEKWRYYRLKGFSKIRAGDVVVFKSSRYSPNILIKRCIGLPGDYLKVVNGKATIKNRPDRVYGGVKNYYKVWFNDFIECKKSLKNFQDKSLFEKCDQTKNFVNGFLSTDEKDQLSKLRSIDSITINVTPLDTIPTVYPFNKKFYWNIDNYGPLLIPAKGTTVTLDEKTYLLYKKIFTKFEKVDIKEKNNHFFLNNKEVFAYTFRKNYYFMLGDNRNNSYDSRFLGIIPEEVIDGKAILIFFPRIKLL